MFTQPFSRDIADYPDGIVLPVDKPYRWTSADVIRKVKFAAIKHFGKKNLKVGHAGTLDPLATGVLLVCIGPATKRAETLQKSDKEYIAEISFGATTPSYDLEKPIDAFYPVDGVSREALLKVLPDFVGEQEQIAPLFSAKSIDGVRAYELARKMFRRGEPIDDSILQRSIITISEIELLGFVPGTVSQHGDFSTSLQMTVLSSRPSPSLSSRPSEARGEISRLRAEPSARDDMAASSAAGPVKPSPSSRINVTDNSALGLPRATIRIACSKGTYIRALARDIGEALGSGAHLSGLIRSRSGSYALADALSLEAALSLLS